MAPRAGDTDDGAPIVTIGRYRFTSNVTPLPAPVPRPLSDDDIERVARRVAELIKPARAKRRR